MNCKMVKSVKFLLVIACLLFGGTLAYGIGNAAISIFMHVVRGSKVYVGEYSMNLPLLWRVTNVTPKEKILMISKAEFGTYKGPFILVSVMNDKSYLLHNIGNNNYTKYIAQFPVVVRGDKMNFYCRNVVDHHLYCVSDYLVVHFDYIGNNPQKDDAYSILRSIQ
ncbi:hypothetical protein ACOBR2_21410 (plasmid) [Telmatobacter bradus]|uniref:hypothetical protein n=1 Tax=Telmatobacter bradus TaxID=474953 RepID=UPI003B43AAF2